jgi:GNAT superfamily N-acetyltransferase
MIRFAKPLRVDERVAKRLPVAMIARGISALVNTGLKLRDIGLSNPSHLTIANEAGPWGEEFTEAAGRWAQNEDFCVARTGPYLNWRFGQHPLRPHAMLTAREGVTLRGFLIYYSEEDHRYIVEFQASDAAAHKALLRSAIKIAREEGFHTLNAPWLSAHPGRRLLESYGFRPRESTPVVMLGLPQTKNDGPDYMTRGWFLTAGDRES